MPIDIVGTLDSMAHGIAIKEGFNPMDIKTQMVNNINKLTQKDAEYLVSNMAVLIDKSTQQNETIDDKNTQKEFITFLINLFY